VQALFRRGLLLLQGRPLFAKSRRRRNDVAMRRQTEVLLTLIGLIAVPSAVVMVHFAGMPVQPAHPAMARVVAIKAWESKFGAYLDTIDVRNATGNGDFSMQFNQVHCRVGDLVPVQQQGVTLMPVAKTCR
jgi:hypothetical protein